MGIKRFPYATFLMPLVTIAYRFCGCHRPVPNVIPYQVPARHPCSLRRIKSLLRRLILLKIGRTALDKVRDLSQHFLVSLDDQEEGENALVSCFLTSANRVITHEARTFVLSHINVRIRVFTHGLGVFVLSHMRSRTRNFHVFDTEQ